MPKVRADDSRITIAIAVAVLLMTGNVARAAEEKCQEFNLASKPDANDLGLKLMGFAAAGIIFATEMAEPKPLKITAAALGGTVASYDLVAIVRKYFGSTTPVTLCPGEPNQSPVLGTDRPLVEALAFGKPQHPRLFDKYAMGLDQNSVSSRFKLLDNPALAATNLTGLGVSHLAAPPPPSPPPTPPPAPSAKFPSIDIWQNYDWRLDSPALLSFNASVSGRIVDGATGGSLADAVVQLTGPEGISLSRETVTTADGTYRFEALLNGTYLLSVRHVGYSSSNRKVELAKSEVVGNQDVTLANTAYPCDYSVINETSELIFLHYELFPTTGIGSPINPNGSIVLRALDRRRQISAESLSGVRWSPYWVECGTRNSVALLPPKP